MGSGARRADLTARVEAPLEPGLVSAKQCLAAAYLRKVTMIPLLAAALLAATPATLATRFAEARAGDTIRLAEDFYPIIRLANRDWPVAVTLDARGANFAGLVLDKVGGLHVQGGSFVGSVAEPDFVNVIEVNHGRDISFDGATISGTGAAGFGANFHWGDDVAVINATFKGLLKGVIFNEVAGGRIADTGFTHMRSDGINIAASHDVVVERVTCSAFSPIPTDHPDCVQMWSVKGLPPTADITIRDNHATGAMEGFSGFDHGDGGFDRIVITGNVVRVSYPHGIALYGARASVVEGNDVATLAGAQYQARINIIDSVDVKQRKNKVADYDQDRRR